MSKIFDALKRAELAPEDSRQAERRRTCRRRVYVSLFVYGYTVDNPFCEDACTVEINAHGGLISMQTAVLAT
jgi:hypothetical protein